MKALLFAGSDLPLPQRLRVSEVPRPSLQEPHDVLLRVLCGGICGTDIHILHGGHPSRPPVILGHEIAAEVVETGSDVPPAHLQKGDRVVIDPNIACPDKAAPDPSRARPPQYCPLCRKGVEEQCQVLAEGTTLGIFQNGGLAGYLVAPQGALYKAPHDMDPARAVLAEPLSCIEHSVDQASLTPGSTCLILGGGPMGALYAMKARSLGIKVLLNEVDPLRRALARRYLEKEEYALNVFSKGELAADVRSLGEATSPLLGGNQPDAVVDAVGILASHAVALCRPGGTAVLLGMNQKAPALDVHPYHIVREGKKIVGSYIGKGFFPKALHTLTHGLPGLEHFTYGPVPLEKALEEAFPALGYDPNTGKQTQAKSLKVLLRP